MNPAAALGPRLLAAAAGLVLSSAVAAFAAEAAVNRVLLLPLFGRTTVVIEFSERISHLEHAQVDPTTVVVEGGPVASGLSNRKFEPAGPAPLVSGVSLTTAKRPDGTTYFRMRIALTGQALHTVRTAGPRVYVDLSPPAPPGDLPPAEPAKPAEEVRRTPPVTVPPAETRPRPPAAPETPPKPAPVARTADAQEPPQKQNESAPAGRAAPPARKADADAGYRELESTTLTRARELSTRPDVRGLLRLKEDVQKRDEQLGKQQPELVNRVLDEISRLTDSARALQLERDRGSFKEK